MVEYQENQIKLINNLFDEFNNSNIMFVVPRGYSGLPKSVPGVDIDILVHHKDFENATRIAKTQGFNQRNNIYQAINNLFELCGKAVDKPNQAVKKLKRHPKVYLRKIVSPQNQSNSLRGLYQESKMSQNNVHIHLFNHLAYKSPLNGSKVRVDPSVEEGMLKRRERNKEIPSPHPPDELVHLICRGIFDKKGDFPNYYTNKCDELWESVAENEEQKYTFNELLELVFYQADTVVEEAVINSEYDSLYNRLKKFEDY